MLSDIRAKLEEKLLTLVWDNKPFVAVKPYHTNDNEWYPYVTFEPTDFQAQILDTCTNTRIYNFDVIIFQEITKNWRDTALSIVIKGIEDIIDLLDKNWTLDWLCLWGCSPVNANFGTFVYNNGDTMFGVVKVSCKAIEQAK